MTGPDSTSASTPRNPRADGIVLLGVGLIVLLAVFVLTGSVTYLAYHSIVEIFVAAVALAIFTIAWHTRGVAEDDYVTVLGIAQLFVAVATVLHTLAYKGMNILPATTVTTGSQLWIITRSIQAAGLLVAPSYIGRRLRRPWLMVLAFGVPVIAAVAAVFAGIFPVTFVEGQGLTGFKIYAEYVIMASMGLGLWMLWRKRDRFEPGVFNDLAIAIGAMIVAEFAFTEYASLFDVFNVAGHVLHLISFYFLYRALVARSLEDPFSVLFHKLARREEALREEHRLSEGLNRVAAAISSSLDADDIMGIAVVEAAEVSGADAAVVALYDGVSSFHVRYAQGEPFELERGRILDRAKAPHLFQATDTGEPVLAANGDLDETHGPAAERRLRSLLSIPLITRGKPMGAMSLHWHDTPPPMPDERLLRFARKLGAWVSLALANAQLYEGEHKVAETLQTAMTAQLGTIPGLEMGNVYRPAPGIGRIGGDFYDVFLLDDGRVAFILGDVSGKGIEAAAANALARSTMRALAYRECDPAKVLGAANEALSRQLEDGELVTAAFGVLDLEGLGVTIGLAGHPEPIVCGRPELAPAEDLRSPPLGIVHDVSFNTWDFRLNPGDALVLFSDGICEARRGTGMFGIDRVRDLVEPCDARSPQEIADMLVTEVESYSEDGLRDDIAVLVLRPRR